MEKTLLRLDLGNRRSGQAKHELLKDHLLNEILTGRLKPGEVLPSDRHFEKTLGVARMTVRQAMASLENDGLIRRVQGKGTYVESNAREKLQCGQDIFALVVPGTRGGFYPSLLHGFEAAVGDICYQTIISNTDNDVSRQGDTILQLIDRKVGGVAIVPSNQHPTPAYQIRQLHERGIPVVFCHRRVEGISAPLLAIPFHEVGRLAGQALTECGHRRVALFASHVSSVLHTYEAGLREAIRGGGGDIPAECVYVGQSMKLDEEAVWAGLQRIFADPNPPTAIVASFDSLAEMIYLLLPRLGLRVPEDVSLVGFGGSWREEALMRRLTSVVVDEITTGQKAVSLLYEMRSGKRALDDSEEIVLPISLSEGESVACLRPQHQ